MTTDIHEDGSGARVHGAPVPAAAREAGTTGGPHESDVLSLSISPLQPTTDPAQQETANVAEGDSTAHGLTRLVHQETRGTDEEAVGWPAPPPAVVIAVAGLSVVAAGLGVFVWRACRRSGGPMPHAERLAWKARRR